MSIRPRILSDGLRTVEQIDLKEMILGRIKKWETDHGLIPADSFVALRTDWSKRWPDDRALQNKDEKGVAHFPGWSLAALKYLYEER